jgi:CpeT protein
MSTVRNLGSLGLLLVACALGCGASDPSAAADAGSDDAAADAGDAAPTPDVAKADEALTSLQKYLTGSFDSADQAKRDPSYFDIRLVICEVAAPEIGPRVLYVEQARADSVSAPYRQRLYVLESKGDLSVSRVFEFKLPARVKGLCNDPTRVALGPGDVEERAGCRVELTWDGVAFKGGTVDKECGSTLNGATYATSEVTLDAAGMKSWDRGFDAAGKQVWGATKGAYEFVRRSPLP